jgi:putative endonuclease
MTNSQLDSPTWVIYLLECRDGTWYTGITNNLEKRIKTHNLGHGAKYTRGRLPVRLLECITVNNQSEALRLERHIKQLPKLKKRQYFQEN